MINHKKTLLFCAVFVLLVYSSFIFAADNSNNKSPVSVKVTEVPEILDLPDFYKKYVDANGIPIVSSEKVRDVALQSARITVLELMAKREDVRKALIAKKFRIMIIGENEEVCDLPEYAPICNTPENIKFWNWRARGFGSDPEGDCGASCGEENVLCLPGDRYEGESILVHEFAHTFHLVGIAGVDHGFNARLQKMFLKAKSKGLWANTYAMTDSAEYFAEAVQSFFNTNRSSEIPNGVHGPISTREKLKQYDPEMYNLLLEFFDEKDLTLCNNSADAPVYFNSPGVFNPIIPGYFADPEVKKVDDTYYLFSKTEGDDCLNQVWESKDFVNWTINLSNQSVALSGNKIKIPANLINDTIKYPFIFKKNNLHYLTYSTEQSDNKAYSVKYAVSKKGESGPYIFPDNNTILVADNDGTVIGPGQHSVFKEGNDYFIVYNRQSIPESDKGYKQVCADKLTFNKDGSISKTKSTHMGVGFLQTKPKFCLDQAYLKRVKASSSMSKKYRPMLITDDNKATMWRAAGFKNGEWVAVDFTQDVLVKRILTQFEFATIPYQYIIETSSDEKNWKVFSDRSNNTLAGSPMIDCGDAVARYVRLRFTGSETNSLIPAIWNLKIYSDNNEP
jgi:alpha-glucosidase